MTNGGLPRCLSRRIGQAPCSGSLFLRRGDLLVRHHSHAGRFTVPLDAHARLLQLLRRLLGGPCPLVLDTADTGS